METIHQGIGFYVEVGSDEALEVEDVVIALRNPATDYSVAFLAEQQDETTLVATLSPEKTAEMPVGNYNLEVYTNDKRDILHFQEDYARVIPSSATQTEEFIRVSYIVVNGYKYFRDSAYDVAERVAEEAGWRGVYAWRVADDNVDKVDKSVLRSVYDNPSAGDALFYVGGETYDTEFTEYRYRYPITAYIQSNV